MHASGPPWPNRPAAEPWAIACMAGGFKAVFVHGFLQAFEARGLRAHAYGCASSSFFPAGYAAAGEVRSLELTPWQTGAQLMRQPGATMSDVSLETIARLGPRLKALLFAGPQGARFLVAASRVITPEASAQTQGPDARKLGRRLLAEAARGNARWRDAHLALELFGTAGGETRPLTRENLEEVAYASNRMLHTGPLPATIGGQPYIDASYTCLCPALELAERGYRDVVVIGTEPGPLRPDLFTSAPLPPVWNNARLHFAQPPCDLADLGVDYTSATAEGLEACFEEGCRCAERFLAAGPFAN
jgi:hypothetical protein